jgi:glucosylceramidase
MKYTSRYFLIALLGIAATLGACSKKGGTGGEAPPVTPPVTPPVIPVTSDVGMWLTNGDQSKLFEKQNVALTFAAASNANPTITVDTTQSFQTIDGFGFALTGGSATLINSLPTTQRDNLLKELFTTDDTHIGVSYLRISLGASDLSAAPFSYDDLPSGTTDLTLGSFSIEKENTDLIPVLKKIIELNPSIKILSCPWSAPTWMKDNNSFYGGSLKKEYYATYAQYFVKYIKAMAAVGITIDAITPQNEPLNAYNNPSMLMVSADQGDFVKNHLGPAFRSAGISTKIIVYDHNADHAEYPMDIYKDAATANYIDGAAFHLYGGDISALNTVHDAYPTKNLYFTEQATFKDGSFGGDMQWHVGNLIVLALRNWSRNVLEWNLASDPNYGPHTVGGCSTCLGAVTIGSSVSRNVSYYIIAHASKFVRPGSVRIASNIPGTLLNVAFKNPEGKKVLVVVNTGGAQQTFNIKFNSKIVISTLNAGAVATYIW